MAFYVLLGGPRNGHRIVTDRPVEELRFREDPNARRVDRYVPERERRDGFTVARHVARGATRALRAAAAR